MRLGSFGLMIMIKSVNRRFKKMININLDQESTPTKKDREEEFSYAGLGIALGASLGFIFGLLLFEDNFALGIGVGLAIGLIVGSIMDVRRASQ
jgi:hypothetical protein